VDERRRAERLSKRRSETLAVAEHERAHDGLLVAAEVGVADRPPRAPAEPRDEARGAERETVEAPALLDLEHGARALPAEVVGEVEAVGTPRLERRLERARELETSPGEEVAGALPQRRGQPSADARPRGDRGAGARGGLVLRGAPRRGEEGAVRDLEQELGRAAEAGRGLARDAPPDEGEGVVFEDRGLARAGVEAPRDSERDDGEEEERRAPPRDREERQGPGADPGQDGTTGDDASQDDARERGEGERNGGARRRLQPTSRLRPVALTSSLAPGPGARGPPP
jgi:hypothetical protein